jgi:hypothetical protein
VTSRPDDEDFLESAGGDDDDAELDEAFPLGDGTADTEAEVSCPWCGEGVTIAVDPGGGEDQQYVEDCQVCCRPWHVHVVFDGEGHAVVHVDAQGDWDD